MLRPLLLDVLYFILPLALGVLAFTAGRSLRQWPRAVGITLGALAISIVVAAGLVLARVMPMEVTAWLSPIGGATVLLGWVAMFLIGVVWNVRARSTSTRFLAVLLGLAGLLIVIETSGPLWWRLLDTSTWSRKVNDMGDLQQSTGATCSPAAAVMLLHRLGIQSSEGEMAYLAGTSFLGTDAYAMARALREKVGSKGWNVEVRRLSYDDCIGKGPFLAHIRNPAGHAILVEKVTPTSVSAVDPADLKHLTASRAYFESIWDGTGIFIDR
jgi:hypothetical protein